MQHLLVKPVAIAVTALMLALAPLLAACLPVNASATPATQAIATAIPSTPQPVVETPQPFPSQTPSPAAQVELTATGVYLPLVTKPSPTPFPTPPPGALRESFEGAESGWSVQRETAGSGTVTRSSAPAYEGSYAARAATNSANAKAQVQLAFSDPAVGHTWQERPGSYYWQQALVYIPAATLANLGASGKLTLAGLYPSAGGAFGWWLQLRQDGALWVKGFTKDGKPVEFNVYGSVPADTWFSLEIGLHSQSGPGVKRGFAFLVNGAFYGWYHQGNMVEETYDRAAIGILSTNSAAPLEVFVDRWINPTTARLPSGLDNRPTAGLQEQDYRTGSGEMWQIDWSTWENDLRLDPIHGIYSASYRFQSGRNGDRMPDLTSGWAEIEIGTPGGKPPAQPCNGAMVAFRKEVNREENLEIIPICQANGKVNLVLEAWVNGAGKELQQWPMPFVPDAGDVLRARWQQLSSGNLAITASYYDASAAKWYPNVINYTLNAGNVDGVDFNDGFHQAASNTIDTPAYSIRRYKVGVLSTYPGP